MECACLTCDKHGEDLKCHSTCEKYLAYQRENDERKRIIQQKRKDYTAVTRAKVDGIKRMRKSGGKNKR